MYFRYKKRFCIHLEFVLIAPKNCCKAECPNDESISTGLVTFIASFFLN